MHSSHTQTHENHSPPFAVGLASTGMACGHVSWAKHIQAHISERWFCAETVRGKIRHSLVHCLSSELAANDTLMEGAIDRSLRSDYPEAL